MTTLGHAADGERPPQQAAASFSDLVELVRRHGWRVNLRDLCRKYGMTQSARDCIVQQVSVEESEGLSYPRGFNIPVVDNDEFTDVLLYHLNPLIGEFFVVSADGILKAAFVRSKGTDYKQIANDVVREEFERDIAYWKENFIRLRKGLEANHENERKKGNER
ncbi:MAG: hypothetical protein Q8M26_14575 [Pseudolabrys sp.]|nr:hypothetical protein [Pseudolabrys sp.]